MTIDTIYHYSMAIVTVIIGILMLADLKDSRKNIIFKVVLPIIFLSFFTYAWKRYLTPENVVTIGRLAVVIALGLYSVFFSKYNFYTKLLLITVYYTVNILMRDISFVLVYTLNVASNNDLIFDAIKLAFFIAMLIFIGIYIKNTGSLKFRSSPVIFGSPSP